jgi:hypothetical protein
MKIDKTKMMGGNNKPLTTGLFIDLEEGGLNEAAIFTKDEMDKVIGKVTFLSFKRLFVETGDITGYDFAKKYLMGWKHFNAMQGNKKIRALIEEAQEELEVKMLSEALAQAESLSNEGNAAMTKFIAERGWVKGKQGRPSKAAIEKEARVIAAVNNEWGEDIKRLADYR